MTLRITATTFTLVALAAFLGCQDADHSHPGPDAPAHGGSSEENGHSHEEAHAAGPHGGHVYVLGEDAAHAELTHDGDKVVVWLTTHDGDLLDAGDSIALQLFSDGKFLDYSLKKTAEATYELADRSACELLEKTDDLKGRIHATVGGAKITGTVEHHAHE